LALNISIVGSVDYNTEAVNCVRFL
jgi:hypothetical protein